MAARLTRQGLTCQGLPRRYAGLCCVRRCMRPRETYAPLCKRHWKRFLAHAEKIMRYTFKGNPATNDAARYSAARKRYEQALASWNMNGHVGPRPKAPPVPDSLRPAPETEAERAERIARQQRQEAERRQSKLF